jgi:Trypsin-like peptidase domain
MNYFQTFQTFKLSIARIFAGDNVIGAGFLVSDRHLLTCAHVIADVLGLANNTLDIPNGEIEFDLPLLEAGQRATARVIFWRPVSPGQIGEDIAVLQVELAEIPKEAQAIRLVAAVEPWGHQFRIFGFPEDSDNGVWASGVLREQQGSGWVQMEDINAQGYPIQHGFSGAPVWDETLNAVVGMAVAKDSDQEIKAAFMIPVNILIQVLSTEPENNKWLKHTHSLSEAVYQEPKMILEPRKIMNNLMKIKRKKLALEEERLQNLSTEYDEILKPRAWVKGNEITKIELEAQNKWEKMEKSAIQCDKLRTEIWDELARPELKSLLNILAMIDEEIILKAYQSCLPGRIDLEKHDLREKLLRLDEMSYNRIHLFISYIAIDRHLLENSKVDLEQWLTRKGWEAIKIFPTDNVR